MIRTGAAELKAMRLNAGLSQRLLAEKASSVNGHFISQASISLIENGRMRPPLFYAQYVSQLVSSTGKRCGTSPFTPEHRRRKAAIGATWQEVIEAGLTALEDNQTQGVQAAK